MSLVAHALDGKHRGTRPAEVWPIVEAFRCRLDRGNSGYLCTSRRTLAQPLGAMSHLGASGTHAWPSHIPLLSREWRRHLWEDIQIVLRLLNGHVAMPDMPSQRATTSLLRRDDHFDPISSQHTNSRPMNFRIKHPLCAALQNGHASSSRSLGWVKLLTMIVLSRQ